MGSSAYLLIDKVPYQINYTFLTAELDRRKLVQPGLDRRIAEAVRA